MRHSFTRLFCFAAILAIISCDDSPETTTPIVTPVLTSVTVSLPMSSVELGQPLSASVAGVDQKNEAIELDGVVWASSQTNVATVSDQGVVTTVGPGTTTISATSAGKSDDVILVVVAPPTLIINEIESNGGTPGDWVELYNPTTGAIDLSGFVLKDNDDTHSYTFPVATLVQPGAYFVVNEASFGFGLGAPDAVRLYSRYGVVIDTRDWVSHATTTYGRCPTITGAFTTTTNSTKGTANDCSVAIKVNEVESNGGTPGDWIELYNAGPTAVDLSGYILKDNDDTHSYALPAGTVVAAGAFFVAEESQFGFGLGGADAARIFSPAGALVDSYTWDVHAAITYGRCPDGAGVFAATVASTKGLANSCTPTTPTAQIWPGSDDVVTIDGVSVFQTNLSGLIYEGVVGANPSALWAVRNGPGTLFRLVFNGTIWTPDATNSWTAGKALKYLDGLGNPDAEGVTFAAGGSAGGMYVATERNNDASTISRSSILRFDPTQAGATVTATNDWNITADLPVTGANLGIEAITWIPDSYLTANTFFDEKANHTYVPGEYPNHGTGLFFVGVEANGLVYAYALNHNDNTFSRVATISTGYTAVMELQFDRELNYLWAVCDDGCSGLHSTLEIDTQVGSATFGKFKVTHIYNRPSTMPNLNNEGFAFAPQAECSGGKKFAFWSDDGETGGHSIRRASIPCTRFP